MKKSHRNFDRHRAVYSVSCFGTTMFQSHLYVYFFVLAMCILLSGCKRRVDKQDREVPPAPVYPMGLYSNWEWWLLSPDRTAAYRSVQADITIKDFDKGKTFELAAKGTPYKWSPDSQWILYKSDGWCIVSRDGKIHLRITDQGTGLQKNADCLPLWFPDSSAVLIYDKGLYRIVSVDGQSERVLCTDKEIAPKAHFYISPDGRWIIYYGSVHVPFGYLRTDGTGHMAVTNWRGYSRSGIPRWSADCDKVAFLMTVGPELTERHLLITLLVDLPTGKIDIAADVHDDHVLAPTIGPRDAWALSPDAHWIIGHNGETGFFELVEIPTQNRWKLHGYNARGKLTAFRFSPDGRWIAFIWGKAFHILSVEESRGYRLSPNFFSYLTFHIDLDGWTKDGKQLIFGNDTVLYTINVDGSACERIWPDHWKGTVQIEQLDVPRISLEHRELHTHNWKLTPVPSQAYEQSAEVKNLPIQVIEQ